MIPRTAVLALAAGLACGGTQGAESARPGAEVPFTVLQGGPPGRCLPRAAEGVARSRGEWERFWRDASACPDAAPAVDFAREMVVVHALGVRYNGAVGLTLDRISDDGRGGLVVHLTTTSPRPGCPVTANIVYPRVIAVTPQRPGPVRFEVRQRLTRC
jgi:hypothetical protein